MTHSALNPPVVYDAIERDKDDVFVKEYLRLEGRDDAAAVTAYRRAKYFDPAYPVVVAADCTLTRLRSKIEAARKTIKPTAMGQDRSRDSVLADLDQVFESALGEKDHSAAVTAKRTQAQIMGLLSENISVTHKMDVSTMTDEQLLRILNKQSRVVDGQFTEVPIPKGIGHLKPPDGTDT